MWAIPFCFPFELSPTRQVTALFWKRKPRTTGRRQVFQVVSHRLAFCNINICSLKRRILSGKHNSLWQEWGNTQLSVVKSRTPRSTSEKDRRWWILLWQLHSPPCSRVYFFFETHLWPRFARAGVHVHTHTHSYSCYHSFSFMKPDKTPTLTSLTYLRMTKPF